jgi:hypothetical protein
MRALAVITNACPQASCSRLSPADWSRMPRVGRMHEGRDLGRVTVGTQRAHLEGPSRLRLIVVHPALLTVPPAASPA